MSYLGNTPTSQNFLSGTNYFSGNASTTAFTLSRAVSSTNDILVIVGTTVQPPSAYTVSGTTLTFTSAPATGTNNICVRYLSTTTFTVDVSDQSVNTAKVQDGAITSTKLASTAISDKLGYTPISPTDLANSLSPKANTSDVNTSLGLKANLTDLTPTNISDKSNTSTGYFSMPKGTTVQRPVSVDAGDTRFNTTANAMEVYTGTAWSMIGAKDGSSFASAAASATAIYDLGVRGKGLFWIQKADGTPIQVYCDLDTLGQDGKAGWMLVASWATASEWTKDSVSSGATFGSTALNAFSSNFGNTNMQHMRIKVATAVDLASSSSEADWYYYWSSPIQWKTVWAAGSGTNNHYNSAGAVNNGASTPRNSLRQFNFAYNIKWAYTANYQTWANLSDTGTSGSTGTEAWYDWYSGLTTAGYTLGVNNAGGAGRGDGSLAITFGGDTSTTAGHDCNYANAKYGYDDTGVAAWAGTSGSNNMNAQTGTQGANTNMWMWIK